MSKLSDAVTSGINNMREQLYYTNEQLVTGSTITDRSSRELSQDEVNRQQQPSPQPDIEPER